LQEEIQVTITITITRNYKKKLQVAKPTTVITNNFVFQQKRHLARRNYKLQLQLQLQEITRRNYK
jgi:hypothetical protein